MRMVRNFIRKMFRGEHSSLNKIEVSKRALAANLRAVSKASKLAVAPVLKSNAYGHGLREVAKVFDSLRPPFLCVDSIYEGYELMKAGIRTPVLITGYVNPDNLRVKKLPFSYAVYDIQTLRGILKNQPHAGIHLFVDTGMHREGIPFPLFEDFLREMPRGARIEGIMSHLAYGGAPDHPFTKRQIESFNESVELLRGWGIDPPWKHVAASSALLLAEKYGDRLGNLGRAGLSLYGISDKNGALFPALRFLTTLVQMKTVKKGDRVGYDFSFVAEQEMRIGVLPAGYNDGVDMRLFGKGIVLLRGVPCPIVGKVSMNVTVVDVTDVPEARIGDEVTIYSSEEGAKNSIRECAKACGAIPYELLVHLHPSTKRVVVD